MTAELVIFLPRFHHGLHRRRHGEVVGMENGRPVLSRVLFRRHHVKKRPDAREGVSEHLAVQQRLTNRVRRQGLVGTLGEKREK